jgi:hypothetical protein
MKRSLLLGATVLATVALASGPIHAHESRAVGPVTTVVGWVNEPAFAGSVNGVSFRATRGGAGITGATLKADVTFEGAASPLTLTLEPAFNDPGHYKAALVPTRAGAYTFRIYGELAGKDFDQSYTASEETFAIVEATAAVEYPEKDPTRDELAALAQQQTERIDALKAAAAGSQDAANMARILAIVALVIGVAGVALGLRKGKADSSR